MRSRLLLLVVIVSVGATPICVAQVKPRAQQPERPAAQAGEVGKFSGAGSCAASNCHGSVQAKSVVRVAQNEYSIWAAQDKHARAYTVLSNAVSVRIGKILGLQQPPNKSPKCLACHALNVGDNERAQTFTVEDGVSCESCHGPAVGWLGPHTTRGWIHDQSIKLGMYDTRNLVKRSEKCLGCHLGTSDKEVDHVMIAAGHPDLTFELESFSAVMPRHWRNPPNANPWLNVQELAVGQAVQLREALNRLDRRASGPNWPEYSEYDCFACHHSLTKPEASWRQAMGYDGRVPGAPTWNQARFAVFRHIADQFDPGNASQLTAELQKIIQTSGKPASANQVAASAKHAAGLADQIAAEVQAKQYDRDITARLLHAIAGDSQTISEEGERSAEQAAMALDSLFLAYSKNQKQSNEEELKAAINGLFQQLDNPSAYNAPRFATQMQKVSALLSRIQPTASEGTH